MSNWFCNVCTFWVFQPAVIQLFQQKCNWQTWNFSWNYNDSNSKLCKTFLRLYWKQCYEISHDFDMQKPKQHKWNVENKQETKTFQLLLETGSVGRFENMWSMRAADHGTDQVVKRKFLQIGQESLISHYCAALANCPPVVSSINHFQKPLVNDGRHSTL